MWSRYAFFVPLQSLVFNVTNQLLMIQPILLQQYTDSESIVDFLSEEMDSNLDFNAIQTNFFLFPKDHPHFESESSMTNTVLQPNDPFQITVTFAPKVDAMASTLLLVRNNLTVLDYMVLRGRGIQGVFSIDGIQPGSDPLEFEFTQSMMEQCHGKSCGCAIYRGMGHSMDSLLDPYIGSGISQRTPPRMGQPPNKRRRSEPLSQAVVHF